MTVFAEMQGFSKDAPIDLYITGPSYGGHFVPATGDAISKGNMLHNSEYIALKGISVGNGLTDPEIQYAYYPQMAFHPQQDPDAAPLKPIISKQTYDTMVAAVPGCVDLIKQCKTQDGACSQAFMECNAALIDPVQETGINQYDIREKCKHPPLCGDYSNVHNFLNSVKVQKTLGVHKTWQTCNFGVNGLFHVDWMHSQVRHIPSMMKNGIRVQLYAGDVDFICNWMGNKAWALNMDWPGKAGFNAAKDESWVVNGKQVGRVRKSGLFSFVQIHHAGHMVPQDQPAVSMLMAEAFTAGKLLVN
jgi:cathepsin A (carboxypeptidase C)